MDQRRILLVEDDPNDVFFVQRAFRRAAPHITLTVAGDGETAQELLEKRHSGGPQPPDLVLMDIKLPRRDGLETLAWIRRHFTLADLPVILLTSSSERTDLEQAYRLGVNAFLTKPGDPGELQSMARGIAAFLETRQERHRMA